MTPRTQALEAELARHPHGRVPRELRRRQLLELATALFSERGYAAASMDELAARAGISKPVIYGLFGSKEGVLIAAIEDLGDELNRVVFEAVAGKTTPEELLRSGSLAFFRFIGERSETWAMIFGTTRSLSDASPEATARLDEIRRRQDVLVEGAIHAAARGLGGDPDPLEVSAITRGLNGVYEGLVEWWVLHPEVEAEQLAEWVVALVLPGLEAMAERARGAGGV